MKIVERFKSWLRKKLGPEPDGWQDVENWEDRNGRKIHKLPDIYNCPACKMEINVGILAAGPDKGGMKVHDIGICAGCKAIIIKKPDGFHLIEGEEWEKVPLPIRHTILAVQAKQIPGHDSNEDPLTVEMREIFGEDDE